MNLASIRFSVVNFWPVASKCHFAVSFLSFRLILYKNLYINLEPPGVTPALIHDDHSVPREYVRVCKYC